MSPFIEIPLRSISIYVFIVLAIRFFGKKELTQLSVIDLVFILLISNSVQNAMVGDNTTVWGGTLAAAALFSTNYIFKQILYKSKSVNEFIQGDPVLLIHNGIVIQENLKKERISMQEIEASVREHGVPSIDQVDLAVLEVDGNISILSEKYQHHTQKKRKAHKILKT
ncbi:MAG: DUF421 domain-containing protein [Bacteroidetes bacterium]|nr:DUF421 domain-containing protein [Bacteroidota bacterium]MBP6648920.1 DUF421 domain-containing protein [Bacteroidia bacterium]